MKLYDLFENLLSIPYERAKNYVDFATRYSDNVLYIYFQHSNGALDWKSNFDFPVKLYSGFYVHRGFLSAWKIAQDHLKSRILDTGVRKIVVSGYSHGAALAILCHGYIYDARPDIRESIESYGFGSPRVFWGIKTQKHEEIWAHFTVVKNIDDFITHLPPSVFGFFHIGKLIEIGKRGLYSPIDAHRPESYLSELKRLSE